MPRVGLKISNAWHRRTASPLSLSAGILLVLLHGTIDFTFYFIPTFTLLALMIAWPATAEEAIGDTCSPRSAPCMFYV